MKRTLYFVMPDKKSASRMLKEMLLAHVELHCIHFFAKSRHDLGDDLPHASIWQRTYMLLGGFIGMGLGALLGLLAGGLALMFPPWYVSASPVTILIITTAIGAVCGALWTAVVSSAIPNNHLAKFRQDIADGHIVMMVKVPFHDTKHIHELVEKRHPDIMFGGSWPVEHATFP